MSKNKLFVMVLSIFFISLFLTIFNSSNDVFAITDDDNNTNDGGKKFQLNMVINLNTIQPQNPQLFKLVAFINGEMQTKIVDVKKNATLSKNSKITVPFYFDKSNDVSEINVGDEYFVCGYIVKRIGNVNASSNNQLMPYDCNEGGIASTTKDSIGLFSTMTKFDEGSTLYQASLNTPSPADSNKNNKEVKITLLNPLDAKKIKDLDNVQFTAMVKGEYQIKKINIKDEIKKSKIKDTLKVPFVFNSNTDIGPVQIGDYYFGCITANDYWSKEHSECEKRFIQHLDKTNDLPVAH
ncbi:MAG TPA: hypothetical protein VFC05_09640 [Nitrososphaeraceae archaeon]|nr:hypothetical protein [Nitrososphaeraceae archaeon]